MHMRKHQRGMGIIGLIFMFGMIAVIATLTIKTVPIYLNQMAVARSVHKVVSDPENSKLDIGRLRIELQRYWDIEDIKYLDPADIKLKRTARGRYLSYDYEAREHLFYNIYLVIVFAEDAQLAVN